MKHTRHDIGNMIVQDIAWEHTRKRAQRQQKYLKQLKVIRTMRKVTVPFMREIYNRHQAGERYQDIAEQFDITRQYAQRLAERYQALVITAFPNLSLWLEHNHMTIKGLTFDLHVSSAEFAHWFVDGEADDMPKSIVDRLLRLTGMPYEKLFQK